MTDRMLTAMFDTRSAAETAQEQLIALGVSVNAVAIRGVEDGEEPASSTLREDRGFWASLSDLFMPDEDRHTYAEGLNRGGYLLSARVPAGLQEAAADILEASEPIDLDERSETWRQAGWAGYDPAAAASAPARAAYGEGAGLTEAGAAVENEGPLDAARQGSAESTSLRPTTQSREMPREVAGSRIRVRSYVTRHPVEEQVEDEQTARRPTGTGTVAEGHVVDPDLAGTNR